jgi:sugar phosphate isomerase/epimerase
MRDPKHVRQFADTRLDVVVTIGERARAEIGPLRPQSLRRHWDNRDPAVAEGTIPWSGFCPLLRRLGYAGNLVLEVDSKNSAFKDPVIFLDEAYKRAMRLR